MIITNSKFSFIQGNGIEAIAPTNTEIYVHFADNGKGKIEIHGKILKVDQEQTEEQPKITSEIGWVRTGVELRADDKDLFTKGHEAIINKLLENNQEVIFQII